MKRPIKLSTLAAGDSDIEFFGPKFLKKVSFSICQAAIHGNSHDRRVEVYT